VLAHRAILAAFGSLVIARVKPSGVEQIERDV
jgi:hypothetical protein